VKNSVHERGVALDRPSIHLRDGAANRHAGPGRGAIRSYRGDLGARLHALLERDAEVAGILVVFERTGTVTMIVPVM
jgi:hypothetical protein